MPSPNITISSESVSSTCKENSSTPYGNIGVSLNSWEARRTAHQKFTKEIISIPNDLKLEGDDYWKIIAFLSKYNIQKIALLINSTKSLSFNGIQESIHHKSSKQVPWKLKKL
jgi:hypothetical protein